MSARDRSRTWRGMSKAPLSCTPMGKHFARVLPSFRVADDILFLLGLLNGNVRITPTPRRQLHPHNQALLRPPSPRLLSTPCYIENQCEAFKISNRPIIVVPTGPLGRSSTSSLHSGPDHFVLTQLSQVIPQQVATPRNDQRPRAPCLSPTRLDIEHVW